MGTRLYIGRLPYDTRERDIEKFFKGYGRIREILMKEGYAFVELDSSRDADDAVFDLNGKQLIGEKVSVEYAGPPRGGRGGGRYRPYGRRDRPGLSYGDRDRYDHRGPPRRGGRGGGSGYRSYGPSRRYSDSRDRPSDGLTYADKYGPPRNTEYRVIVENLSSRVNWQDLKDFMRKAGEVTYADAHKRGKNTGIVDYASHEDMKNAIEKLDGTDLKGRRIRLVEDKSRRRRDNSNSRSNSRSRSSKSKSKSPSGSRSSRERSRSNERRTRSRSKSADSGKDEGKKKNRSRSNSSKDDDRRRSRSRSNSSKDDDRRRSRSRSAGQRSRSGSEKSREIEIESCI